MTLLELLDLTSEELIELLEEQIYNKQEEIRPVSYTHLTLPTIYTV